MSQVFEYLYDSDMLSAFSVILRYAVLYTEFKCQNHTVCMSYIETNTVNTSCSFSSLFFNVLVFVCQKF